MARLRIKVSGCMQSMAGAEAFCAVRSCLSTAARHGIGMLAPAPRSQRSGMGARNVDASIVQSQHHARHVVP
jgi:hypothetical protein